LEDFVKTYLMALLCCLVSAAAADAQPLDRKPKNGERFSYNVESEVEITEISPDDEKTMRATAVGVAELRARKVSNRRIEWTYSAEPLRLRVTNTIGPGRARDTTIRGTSRVFVTDAGGTPVSSTASRIAGSDLSSVLEGIQQNMIKRWILPTTMRKMKPGDGWTEERRDEVKLPEVGMVLDTRFTVNYVFDGIVDTLGIRAVRVRSQSNSMAIRGTRLVDGQKVKLEGDGGSHIGTSYYSTVDGVLIASRSENEVDVRVRSSDSVSGIPMTWRQRATAMRAKE
jgi:hypothetical protein